MKIGVSLLFWMLGLLMLVSMWHEIHASNYDEAANDACFGIFFIFLSYCIRSEIFLPHKGRWRLVVSIVSLFFGLNALVDAVARAIWGPVQPETIDWSASVFWLSISALAFAFWLRYTISVVGAGAGHDG